ncbi:DNA polymerase beta-like, N-terminal domain [Pseudocohnilembus persalinus]|uniref:DNA polymerase beta-like, N-terminal domain n=1 Tax=Pseudocohnilembus persalinus TaxID=266149 RepID=A0A0V0QRG1_PSEPJ|nr:DNA polymerase beta-like, N-terminal domain [Pseudocohnilembus persalinus]|eukprot:KRX04857.1 DNA polymerase beta-like, N-terminal domain [Pseudocohnilembus persalinus]
MEGQEEDEHYSDQDSFEIYQKNKQKKQQQNQVIANNNKKARNPANQFLLNHFLSIKKKLNPNSNLKFTYDKIIKSLKNYILPIVNEKQVQGLNGIGGNKFIKQV